MYGIYTIFVLPWPYSLQVEKRVGDLATEEGGGSRQQEWGRRKQQASMLFGLELKGSKEGVRCTLQTCASQQLSRCTSNELNSSRLKLGVRTKEREWG